MNEEIQITRTKPVSSNPPVENKPMYPTETVELPSRGYFYADGNPLQSGVVEIKMMTAKEEDILTNENLIKKGIVLDKLLESLIVGPSNINYNDLLICDKNSLYVATRRFAYGDNYGPLEVKCPSCSNTNKININLGDVQDKDFDFSNVQKGTNNFKFQLPFSKKNVEYKILNSGEETQIENDIKILSKKLKSASVGQITTRLKRIIVTLDGDPDKSKINSFVDNELLSRDSMALRSDIKNNTPDIDLTYNFVCDNCSHEERLDVPMTVQFFWPDA
jgi:hypothetical protein